MSFPWFTWRQGQNTTRQRLPSAREKRHNDDRPAQVVGSALRTRLSDAEARTCNQSWINVRHAAFVMHVGHWAGDPQCPGPPVNVIELDDVSVQVDVSEVRLLNSSTRLVLAINSMDVGRREGAHGVIGHCSSLHRRGRAWDRAYRQICLDRHAIVVKPESEVYRFGNGGLLTSTERVTDPVVLANNPLLLSCSVVESGKEMLWKVFVWISRVAAKPCNGQSQPLEGSVAGHFV